MLNIHIARRPLIRTQETQFICMQGVEAFECQKRIVEDHHDPNVHPV